jgi:hypothetical protein
MAWATTLLVHTDVLQTYGEGLKEQEPEDPPPKQTDKQNLAENPIPPNLPKSKLDNMPPNNGKDKMPPMERKLTNQLKQMR